MKFVILLVGTALRGTLPRFLDATQLALGSMQASGGLQNRLKRKWGVKRIQMVIMIWGQPD